MAFMTDCIRRVATLSRNQLLAESKRLVGVEKVHVARLLAHLAEIWRRKIHIDEGYSGLYCYAEDALNLSESESALRCRVARVCGKFPGVLESLARNRMTMTVASMLSSHLTAENVGQLIADCEGLSKRKAAEYLVRIKPKEPVSSGVRRASSSSDTPDNGLFGSGAQRRSEDGRSSEEDQNDEPNAGRPESQRASDTSQPARSSSKPIEAAQPDVFNIRFPVDRVFMEKIERWGEVCGVDDVSRNFATLFEKALDIALKKKDPIQRQERRKEREAKKTAAAVSAETEEQVPSSDESESRPDATPESSPPKEHSRYIPDEARERVLERAGHQCEFVGGSRRCQQRSGLHIDHVHPFGKQGSSDESNLRALCEVHNLRCAEQEYGESFVQSKIEARRVGQGRQAEDRAGLRQDPNEPDQVRERRARYQPSLRPRASLWMKQGRARAVRLLENRA